MSQFVPPKPRLLSVKRGFALVASQFNPDYVDGLIGHCTDELEALSPASSIVVHRVPGAFEIPLLVREIAAKGGVDAIIALGVIIQGKTAHATYLGQTVTQALQDISLRSGIPVVHAVLSLKNEEQARQRCLEEKINRGTEAARVAFEMANLLAELRK